MRVSEYSSAVNADSLQILLQSCAQPILLCDRAQKILWHNPCAAEVLGKRLAPNAVLGSIIDRLAAERLCAARQPQHASITHALPHGAEQTLSVWALPLKMALPQPEIVLLLVHNSAASDLALSEREDLLSSAAHDLKNPLGAIFGYTETLLETQAGHGTTPQQRQILARIRSTAGRCIELVRNYQYLSQTHSKPALPAQAEINTAIKAALEGSYLEAADEARFQLELESQAINVAIPRIDLERVILNLCSNALRYSPGNTVITIRSKLANGSAVVEIHNMGSYIPKHELRLIFERHFRGASSSGTSGSGLGLYIVKTLLAKYGAGIEIESSAESGTTARLTFQVKAPSSVGGDQVK